jgi:hypothetical protein
MCEVIRVTSFGLPSLPAGMLTPVADDASCWFTSSQASCEDAPGVGEPAVMDGDAALEGATLGGPRITIPVEALGDGVAPGPLDGPIVADDRVQAATMSVTPMTAAVDLIRSIRVSLLRPGPAHICAILLRPAVLAACPDLGACPGWRNHP